MRLIKQAPMKPALLRPTLGLTAILLVIFITYRKTASGSSAGKNAGKLLTVTAASRLSGHSDHSPVLVKGLMRKDPKTGDIYLLDEDSISTNQPPLVCRFSAGEVSTLQSLAEDTELVIEGNPGARGAGLNQCTIISINNGTVYADPFPEH